MPMLFFVNILVECDMSKKALGKRNKTAPKRELEELIELANLVPPTMKLKSLNALLGESEGYVGPRPGTPKAQERQERLRDAFIKYVDDLPPRFVQEIYRQSFLLNININEISDRLLDMHIDLAIEKYERFLQIRRTFRELFQPPPSGISLFPNPLQGHPVKVLSVEEIGVEDGRFKRSGNPVAAALDGEEVARLRECERCQRIFWAYNIRSRGCSKPCVNVLRQRDYYNQHYRKGR